MMMVGGSFKAVPVLFWGIFKGVIMENMRCWKCGSGCRSVIIEGPPKTHHVECKDSVCGHAADHYVEGGRKVVQLSIPYLKREGEE